MADHAQDGDNNDGDVFIYRGGRAPQHITHALIDESVDEIEAHAFRHCENLVQVDTHNGLRKIGKRAFYGCNSLPRINLKSAVEIGKEAFFGCENLESVEFGDRLERIGVDAFGFCTSLQHLRLPSIITIGIYSFGSCKSLTNVEFSERLETIRIKAFHECERLQRIAIPLKRDLFEFDDEMQQYSQFSMCEQLRRVDLVGQAHIKTIASLHMESWRADMIAESNRINQILPNTTAFYGQAGVVRQWMESLLDKMDRYKAEHVRYVKEGITLLELALWKAKLHEREDDFEEVKTKKAKIDASSVRKEKRITCGAETVIKNVLPFLRLE